MTATDYLEGKILDHVLRNTAFVQPTGLWLAMHTADPTEVGNIAEVVGGGYARQTITFSPQSGSTAASSNAQNFTNMPALTVTHFTIKDAVTAGNTLFWGVLSIQRTLSAGDPLSYAAGQILISCD
jgi:hypothetical protein